MALEKLVVLTKKFNIKVQENINIRSYPDVVLSGGILGKRVIALDIKTGRRVKNKTGFTLGRKASIFGKHSLAVFTVILLDFSPTLGFSITFLIVVCSLAELTSYFFHIILRCPNYINL